MIFTLFSQAFSDFYFVTTKEKTEGYSDGAKLFQKCISRKTSN